MSTETLGEALVRVRRTLVLAGLEDAGTEARLLVAWASGHAVPDLLAREGEMLEPAAGAQLLSGLAQRLARVPLAHILGSTDFHTIRVRTDSRALVPRSDSETLVNAALALIPVDADWTIADLGTGSGCLLAAVLAQRPGCRGVAVEADPQAAALAAENFAALGPRVTLIEASWDADRCWTGADLVLSNPPYIRSDVIAGLAPEVRDHDPLVALDGGPDGLVAYREIITLARAGMRDGTPLLLEIGHDQAEAVWQLLESGGFSEISLHRDLGDRPRVLLAVKNSTRD